MRTHDLTHLVNRMHFRHCIACLLKDIVKIADIDIYRSTPLSSSSEIFKSTTRYKSIRSSLRECFSKSSKLKFDYSIESFDRRRARELTDSIGSNQSLQWQKKEKKKNIYIYNRISRSVSKPSLILNAARRSLDSYTTATRDVSASWQAHHVNKRSYDTGGANQR